MLMAGYAKFFILLFIFLLLSSCAKKTNNIYVETPEAQRRAMIRDFAQQVSKKGVIVTQVGDTIGLVFPERIAFRHCSANLNTGSLLLLDHTAQLMRKLETIAVQVSGYTDCKASYVLNRSLSKRQAEVFAEYLFERGLDARLVHTVGYATEDPAVTTNAEGNRRIEILFQYLPLLKQY
ncbi:MAG: cell envelope biosis protein OmpA [Gammaproteobacteria bacterium]|jgi:intracellular multiplication protein IcmN|nr:cell envelope biosis protein OmpA [Gammaproteobacteria bacterium]